MSRYDWFVGIDPGVGEAMPGGMGRIMGDGSYQAFELPRAGKIVAIDAVIRFIPGGGRGIIAIEQQHGRPQDGVSSLNVMLPAFGQLVGMCQALEIGHVLVAPTAWKKVVLAGTARDKAAACDRVARLWPQINLHPGHRRKAHDGIADAMCIAEWAWRTDGSVGA